MSSRRTTSRCRPLPRRWSPPPAPTARLPAAARPSTGPWAATAAAENAFGLDVPSHQVMRPWGSPSQHNIIRHQAIRSSARASGDLVEAFNDTVYVQTGMPVGVPADDLTFTSLMRNGHIRTTTGQFTAGAIVSDEMRPSIVMANFNFPGAPANSVAHAVPDPVTNNYRYKLGRATLTKVGESPSKRRSPACR